MCMLCRCWTRKMQILAVSSPLCILQDSLLTKWVAE